MESGRQTAQSVADTVRRMMNAMAATGMGADAPPSEPPRTFPLLAASTAYAEEKYKDDYYDEVDNSFDYIPVNELTVASESSEDVAAEEDKKEDEEVLLGTDGDVAVEPPTDTRVIPKVVVERDTVIRDTTVVTEYAQVVAEEDVPDEASSTVQLNKLMDIIARTSSAVGDQQTSPTLEAAATSEGTNGSTDDIAMEIKVKSASGDDESDADERSPTQPAEADEAMAEDVTRGTPSSGDLVHEADAEMSGAPQDPAEKSAAPLPPQTATSAKANPPLVGKGKQQDVCVKPLPATANEQAADSDEDMESDDEVVGDTPPSAEENDAPATPDQRPRKKKSSSPSKDGDKTPSACLATPTAPDTKVGKTTQGVNPSRDPALATALDSPKPSHKKTAAAPVHTPKQPKRAVSKKRKAPATTLDGGGSEDDRFSPRRRSSRIKHEPPKFTYPVKKLADETVMDHFDRREETSAASSPAMSGMSCEYCGKQMTASRGVANRHLKVCPGFSSPEPKAAAQEHEANPCEAKPALTSSVAAAPTQVQTIKAEASDRRLAVVQLMGSQGLAHKVKGAFQKDPFAGLAAVSRFDELVRNDVTGLRHLDVQALLDAVDAEDGTVVQLRPKLPGVRRSTGCDVLESVSKAKARDLEDAALRFPAPRTVADQFIVPLARELGLEYAMHLHVARFVNCPLDETILDWQFRRSETVVFQLRGKAMWRLKKSRVEYPLASFHPESWQLEDVAHDAKVQRLASMGCLAPPGEDVDVFDESATAAGATELHEHTLTPGAVLYLPAGVWFEAETQGRNTLWLEVQLGSLNYKELVCSALVQLCSSDKQGRMGLQLYPGNRTQTKQARHHAEACFKSLREELTKVEGGDVLPEYLVTEDMEELVAEGLVQVTDKTLASTSVVVDLTNPRFKLKRVKVFRGAAYRVNPIALLMNIDEIPRLLPAQRDDDESVGDASAASITPTRHRALKRTPKPKPKRKQALRATTHTGKQTYVLDESFGNDKYQSQLHVKFQCSAEHSRLVEWLRDRGSEPFDLDEFSRGDGTLLDQGVSEEKARNLLRFLCFVGYVTQAKAP
ncbi:hypothetical protein PHYPSEUDO_003294 [Phytophthora pseudosyringae]|uniref:JmjC domain-containing protein n=1 Tax=Phytophthora pseudosyringae TaxID=221518 RepID=A0A8T1VRN5_9STRA|nr:hypothetical protein PHYPSEUDO_003294 [Phytophthora pseudosyringae]